MPIFATKNDFVEFVCKFKGHVIGDEAIRHLLADPEEVHTTACQRCKFQVIIEMDPEDQDCCLVSDTE